MVTTLLRPWENSFRKRGGHLCQSAHTTLLFQLFLFCQSSVCLTQVTQLSPPVTRVTLRTILYLRCTLSHLDFACSGVSLSPDVLHPCLCTTGAALPASPTLQTSRSRLPSSQLHSPPKPCQLFPGSPGTCSICW